MKVKSMINRNKCTKIYKMVYRKILQKKYGGVNFISPIELIILIRKAQKETRIFLNYHERNYVIGYFKNNRILIPSDRGLEINVYRNYENNKG